jgi:hypothetical protein
MSLFFGYVCFAIAIGITVWALNYRPFGQKRRSKKPPEGLAAELKLLILRIEDLTSKKTKKKTQSRARIDRDTGRYL